MNNTYVIIAIVGAFIVGTISANPIVDAAKPLTEVFIANDSSNPIPVTSDPSCPEDKVKIIDTYTFSTNPAVPILHDTREILFSGGNIIHLVRDLDRVVASGNDIRDIIDRLNELGYYTGSSTNPQPIGVTDVYGQPNFVQSNIICMDS